MMKAIVESVEKDELGKGLQRKCQNELLGHDRSFVTRTERRKPENVKPSSNPLNTPQSTWENEAGSTLWPPSYLAQGQQTNIVVQNFNILNSKFSKRINEITISDQKHDEDGTVEINKKRLPETQPSWDYEEEEDDEEGASEETVVKKE